MDVSGSMQEEEKTISKLFFLLLFYFLRKKYQQTEIVFIRHHHEAKEVDEEEFFGSKESGGTVVSPSLELMRQIIDERYPLDQWNIYGAQCSDGDNFSHDYNNSYMVLTQKIMPIIQFYSYIQIGQGMNNTYFGNSLWNEYKRVREECKHFYMKAVKRRQDVFKIFEELFRKGGPVEDDHAEESE